MSHEPRKILITNKADKDEKAVYRYIEKKFGKVYADRFRDKVIELFKALAVRPHSERTAKRDRSLRVFVLNRQNKVVYKFTDSEIVFVRILSTKTKTASKY